MAEHLVLSGMGPDRPGLAKAISEAAFRAGCNLEDSRMAVLGGEFAILVLLRGEAQAIEDFNQSVGQLMRDTGLILATRSTGARPQCATEPGIPFELSVAGMDHTGIVFQITQLLARHGINIGNLETQASPAPVSGTPMFRMRLSAHVPGHVKLRKVKQELADLCDELNMDFTFEAT